MHDLVANITQHYHVIYILNKVTVIPGRDSTHTQEANVKVLVIPVLKSDLTLVVILSIIFPVINAFAISIFTFRY